VPLRGVFPLSWTLDHAGGIARSSACALAVWEVLAGTAAEGTSTPLFVAGRRFGVLRDHAAHPAIRADVRAAFDDACLRLRDAGATLVDVRIPELTGMAESLIALLLPEAAIIHAPLAAHADAYGAQTRAQLDAGPGVSAVAYLRALAHRDALRAAFDDALAGVDALLSPTAAWVAPAEDPPVDGEDGHAEMLATGPTNLTGHPSVTIPVGSGEGGLPVGLQLTGARGGDRRLLRLAIGAEAVLPRPARPRSAIG
jgi:aspartyl-tRNA(Asn)/glutamyl-tRNA(Gln) amidotransferase subunit A